MFPLDAEMKGSSALVIDGNNASRNALAAMLQDFGVETVSHARRPQDARRILELNRYDFVICDHDFRLGHRARFPAAPALSFPQLNLIFHA